MADDDLLEPEEESGEAGELDETLSEEEAVSEEVEGGEETVAEEAGEAEETVAEEAEEEEGGYEPSYAEPSGPTKPKSDAYTVMLMLSFLLFVAGAALAYMEMDQFYGPFVWF